MTIARRDAIALGTAAFGAAAIPIIGARAAVDDVPTANVKQPEYKIESGASLHVLRPAKFIDPDEVFWKVNTKKFIDATGVDVKVDFVSWEDLRPQLAVVANTGAGADIVISFGSDPHIYSSKLVELTDLADYLGAKYGGWYDLALLYGRKWNTKNWIGLPIGGGTGPVLYRKSWVNQAGYDKVPNDHDGFVVDEKGKVAIDSKETIAALKYATELQKTMIQGTLTWNDVGNNQAYTAEQISLTFNGVSLYYTL